MRGGTNTAVRVDLNALKRTKKIQGVNPSMSTPRLQDQPKDTKITLITKDQLDSLKARTKPPETKQSQSYQQVLSGGDWGPPLSPPVWNTTSETFITQPKSQDENSLEHITASPHPKVQEEVKVLYASGSIGQNCDLQSISEDTQTNIVTVKAYSSVYDEKAYYPEKNFEQVIPKELGKQNYNHLIMQSSSVDITNLRRINVNINNHYLRQEATKSSFNMIKTAERAIQEHPSLEKVLIVERAPRHDKMSWLSKFSNEELHRLLNLSSFKDQINIGLHTLDFDGDLINSVYGSRLTHKNYDGIHLRGPSGRSSFTKSLLNIFNNAGLNQKNTHSVADIHCTESTKKLNHHGETRHKRNPSKTAAQVMIQHMDMPKVINQHKDMVSSPSRNLRKPQREVKIHEDWPEDLTRAVKLQNSPPAFSLPLTNRFEHLVQKKSKTPTKNNHKTRNEEYVLLKTKEQNKKGWHYATCSANKLRLFTKKELISGKDRETKQGLVEISRKFGLNIFPAVISEELDDITLLTTIIDQSLLTDTVNNSNEPIKKSNRIGGQSKVQGKASIQSEKVKILTINKYWRKILLVFFIQ